MRGLRIRGGWRPLGARAALMTVVLAGLAGCASLGGQTDHPAGRSGDPRGAAVPTDGAGLPPLASGRWVPPPAAVERAGDDPGSDQAGTGPSHATGGGREQGGDASTAAGPITAGELVPQGWEPWILHPSKRLTRYRHDRGGRALRADADGSASGLITRVDIDPAAYPVLQWRWKVDSLIRGADVTDRYAEDAPARLVLGFDGDKGKLPLKDRLFFEQVKLFTGRDMPYATLMYVWGNRKPVGTVVHNPHTSRVRKIVVASGADGIGQWQAFTRDIVADFRRAYGIAPGRLRAIAILTDTDNTRERVTAWYDDIHLHPR